MSASQFGLLKTRRFLPLFAAQFLAAFNDNVFKNAIVIMMTYQAGNSMGVDPRLMVTAAAGVFILPFFLFSATAGQLADKHEKSKLIRRIRLAEIPVMVLAAVGFFLANYWLLLAVLFMAGVLAAFLGPLKYSILPEHLREDELIGGNALVESGTFLAILLGTILGGVFILKDGGVLIISATVIALAVFGWFCARFIPLAMSGAPDLSINLNFVSATWRLLRHAATQRDIFLAIIGISWFWLVGFTFLAQFPVYAAGVIGANEEVVTLFLTAFSVGIALGSLLCNTLLCGRVTAAYVPLGAFGMTVSILLLWLFSPAVPHGELIGFVDFLGDASNLPILISLVATAIFAGIYIVPLYAMMQMRAQVAFRSRIIAANNVMNALFMVAGALATMFMLKADMAVTDIFLAVGIANIPVALLIRRGLARI